LWLFLIIAIVASIILGVNLSETRYDYDNEISKLKQQNESLKSENSSLQYKFDNLREQFPLKITRIELANSGDNYNYGQKLYALTLKYLTPKIYFENYLKESKRLNLTINYYDEYGVLEYNHSSGNRPNSEVDLSKTDTSKDLSGWGTESGGSWKSGNWTIEIWYNGVCLGSRRFTIY
jgi:hypothetical protein